ncbi:MAG: glycosyltransferase family 2 protein [Alphaproteobacteria bacterium]|nr:glycosyltransferase family 2 protein [Alphaproteobacteria bacterium]
MSSPMSRSFATAAEPQICVITPAYNAAATLPQTIQSLRAQTMRAWRNIIVDDGSQDATLALARACAARDPRVAVLSQANAGPAAARNAGLARVDAEWVHFLDADDWLSPSFYARALEWRRRRRRSRRAALAARRVGRARRVRKVVPARADRDHRADERHSRARRLRSAIHGIGRLGTLAAAGDRRRALRRRSCAARLLSMPAGIAFAQDGAPDARRRTADHARARLRRRRCA